MRTLLLIMISAVVAGAQSAPPTQPQLVVSGRGEVEVTPDRAELILSVETRAVTGSEAGRLNAQIVAAVLDTLRRGFALTDKDLTTAGYMLRPEMSYPPGGGPPRVEGYVAMNSVRVRTGDIVRIGAMIDAALQKRASNIGGLSFSSTATETARRQALAIAVANARADAEVMAKAAGGTLGDLIELISENADRYRPQPVPMMLDARMSQESAPTAIQASEQVIGASVMARWRFVPPMR